MTIQKSFVIVEQGQGSNSHSSSDSDSDNNWNTRRRGSNGILEAEDHGSLTVVVVGLYVYWSFSFTTHHSAPKTQNTMTRGCQSCEAPESTATESVA
jgi:hypothetical protein